MAPRRAAGNRADCKTVVGTECSGPENISFGARKCLSVKSNFPGKKCLNGSQKPCGAIWACWTEAWNRGCPPSVSPIYPLSPSSHGCPIHWFLIQTLVPYPQSLLTHGPPTWFPPPSIDPLSIVSIHPWSCIHPLIPYPRSPPTHGPPSIHWSPTHCLHPRSPFHPLVPYPLFSSSHYLPSIH